MRLTEVLREEYIFTDLKAREKTELLDEMVGEISSIVAGLDSGRLLSALLEREKLGSTGIGHGVAIPHGKLKGVHDIKVFFGRSRKGVNFSSLDNQPVHLVFLIVAPENSAAAHLKILASISQILKSQDFRTRLISAEDRAAIYRLISDAER